MSDADKIDRDLDAIRALAAVLEETGLTEVEVERGSVRLRVSKAASVSAQSYTLPPASSEPASAPAPETPGPVASGVDHPGAVRSPMVGTAYLSPSPGAAPFISVGAEVTQGQTVMIVEAMKTMNEIKAPRAGKITEITARDAEPVEYDEVLLVIE